MANTVIRYNPNPGFGTLSETVDQLFRDAFTWPRLLTNGTVRGGVGLESNLYETAESYILQVVLPGVAADDLQIAAHRNVVSLSGKAEIAAPENVRSLWVTVRSGEFREQLTLPGEVDAERASADYTDGILTLTLPKAEHTRARTIKIGQAQHPAIEGSTKTGAAQ